MPNPNASSQDWYYCAPSKQADRQTVEPPPASQIPGLSNIMDAPEDFDERQFRRKWIRDSDSNYIKLAKGGGRKGLLSFKTPPQPTEEAELYPRVDWFDHDHPDEEEIGPPTPERVFHMSKRRQPRNEAHRVLPDWYVHEHSSDNLQTQSQNPAGNCKKRANLISYDNMTAAERQTLEDNELNRRSKLPPISKKKQQQKSIPTEAQVTRKVLRLPKIDSEPVNFSHLMSFGYQKDWYSDQSKHERLDREKKRAERRQQEDKRSTQIREAAEMRKPKTIAREDDKPMFKISRFERIQPRVQSFRT